MESETENEKLSDQEGSEESSSDIEPFVSSSSEDDENGGTSASVGAEKNDNRSNNRPFFINLDDTDTSMDDSGLETSEYVDNSKYARPTRDSPHRDLFNASGIKPLTSLAAAMVMKNDHTRKFEHCLAKGASSGNANSTPIKHHNLEESVQAEPWYPSNLSVTSSDFSAIGREDASTPIVSTESGLVAGTGESQEDQTGQMYEPESVIEDMFFHTDAVSNIDLPAANLDEALLQNSTDHGIVGYSNLPASQQSNDPAILDIAHEPQPAFNEFIGQSVPVIQYPYMQPVVINDSYQVPANVDTQYVHPQYGQPPQPTYPIPAVVPTEIQQEVYGGPEIPPVSESTEYHYPSIYVSDSGLITVLLKHDISVEMTVDQTIRLVCHQRKLVVATNSRGDSACIYHPAAKIIQKRTSINADVYLGRRAQMTTNSIIFGNNFNSYKFDYNGISPTTFQFPDISRDTSVQFLFESADYGPAVVSRCNDIILNAHYEFLPQDGVIVRINGVKIIQGGGGIVTIVNGPKYLKMSPTSTVVRLNTHFVEMSVEMNWNVKIRRGCHTLNASHLGFVVSNGKIESGFDESNHAKAFQLPRRIPIRISPRRHRRHIPPANRGATALGGLPLESF